MINFRRIKQKYIYLILSVALFYVSDCFAIGWGDYALDIGNGFTIYKCNTLDISLAKNNTIILHPYDFDHLGPISAYCATKDFVFTKNLGRKPRNHFEGDTLDNVDPSKDFYFIISKKAGQVMGPFSESEFTNHSLIKASGSINWKHPKNPNFFLPLLRSLMALSFLAIHYFWITIPFLILMVYFSCLN